MGTRNSKISPKSYFFGNKGATTSKDEGTDTTVSVPSKMSLNDPKPCVSTKSTSGPPLHLIPHVNKSSPTSVSQPAEVSNERNSSLEKGVQFSIGDKVLGNFEDAGEWFPGVISGGEDGLYDIAYDDGDAEDNVPVSSIKARPSVPPRIVTQNSSDLSKSPPLSAIKAVSPQSRTMSRILSVKSSSKLIPDSVNDSNDNSSTPSSFAVKNTHSSSFKQISVGGKKPNNTKPAAIPVLTVKQNAEVDDYGEYDGSLDFVPHTSSKKIIQVNRYAVDDDDEFAEMEQDEDNRKHLLSNGMNIERSDSAVIKNMYREDSKNALLSSQFHDDKKSVSVNKMGQPAGVDKGDSTIGVVDRSGKVDLNNEGNSPTRANDEVAGGNEEALSNKDELTSNQDQGQHVLEHVVSDSRINPEGEHDPKNEQLQVSGLEEEEDDDDNVARSFVKHEIENSIKMKQAAGSEQECDPRLDTSQVSTRADSCKEKQSDFKEVWSTADDDLFGMNGMDIQRVDSVESVEDGGQDICYYDNSHEQEQDYYDNSHNDSFFNPHVAEQSHADSFYGQHQSGPDWGKISEQSALLYEHEDVQEEVKVEADYGAPTDSGWSLCHTADGTPYFYSYELQESSWELPTNTASRSPASLHSQTHGQTQGYDHEDTSPQAFVPSNVLPRPHSSSPSRHVSQGIAQSKHELAKALNSNKCKSTLHLTNLIEDDDDDAPYDLGLGSMGMITTPLKKVSSTSRLKELPAGNGELGSKGLKRPQSMAAMRKKKKNLDF
mmetsp:Transcript_15727/g.26238  ORF Transcript_15727/g.26238 Transcript_15727/m.26238 type:complete len:770 (+) Transcript_15727:220-2529(+)|eukprot:CAMPEP_0114430018 /NCGR_PEP_ID=MMETSP0103-20121206/9809_1 /TAXON_ID=37642 ORGANISM="Paraphysomonas imperforata, Strain PA2" /NCGR_SAMPLE_ID=MMETSP0103 /ASSEMBLY_ACC=CAM_ASM_000201 /LENGTH=769 /DNA_ID=CAMNT_0001599421 /DNA_START=161 /DNA_END=2470 /DNA_ORIENTATION=-